MSSKRGMAPMANINDQIIFITKNDIFNAIKKRNHFDTFVATLLSAATTCLSALPAPVTINFDTMNETNGTSYGSLTTGRITASALTVTACANSNRNLVSQWRDNLLYVACTTSYCLSGGFSGVVIFAGEKNTSLGQQRITNADKNNNWGHYLEDTTTPYTTNILTAFTTGGQTFTGASSYFPTSPSTDILAFIP